MGGRCAVKTVRELKEILSDNAGTDSHVHTHLCDGNKDMTVESIARTAHEKGIGVIVLTPHFHKRVSDGAETLYEDTDEGMLLSLREEISRYEKNGGAVKLLLSAEADILSEDGDISIKFSGQGEKALDFVSPTLNYHPLLPLSFVRLTYGRYVDALHESGEYHRAAEKAGGIETVLEAMYKTQVNAIERCPYPMMLGHFFMSQSAHPKTLNCFGAERGHLGIMKTGISDVVNACKRKNAFIDLSGVHIHPDESVEECIARNGFLSELHSFTVKECQKNGVVFNYGSDAHSLNAIASSHSYYREIINLSNQNK